jgi:hypothetical protein
MLTVHHSFSTRIFLPAGPGHGMAAGHEEVLTGARSSLRNHLLRWSCMAREAVKPAPARADKSPEGPRFYRSESFPVTRSPEPWFLPERGKIHAR